MRRFVSPIPILVAISITTLASCTGSGSPEPGSSVLAVRISPNNPVVLDNASLAFAAVVILETGEERDVSDSPATTWLSSDTGVVSVNADGSADAEGVGSAYITARHSGITSPAQLVTVNAAPTPTPTPTPAPVADYVVISEVMFNPLSSPETNFEYIELLNPTLTPLDVSGWDIVVRSATDSFVTIGTLTIGAGEYIVISRESVEFPTRYGVTPDATLPFATLGNSGGWLVLRDGSDAPIDEMAWGTGASGITPAKPTGWCATNNPTSGDAESVSRSPDDSDGNTCNDWYSGTPPTPQAPNNPG